MINIKANNSIEIISFDNQLLAKLLMSICSLLSLSCAIIVSLFIIIYVFIINKSRNRSKNTFNVSSFLTSNTCLAIICSSITVVLLQLSTLAGDCDINALNWIIIWACHIRGYLLFFFINSIYLSYVLQAGYRLIYIVFPAYRCNPTVSNVFCCILVQWLLAFIDIIPILFLGENFSNSIVYLPTDFYCQVPVTNLLAMIYTIIVIYVTPLSCLCIIYLWIIIHIRNDIQYRQSMAIWNHRRQNQRDTIIIKRICIIGISLFILSIPSVISFIVYRINDHLHWTYHRLGWMIICITYTFIGLSSICITPQIYEKLRMSFGYLIRSNSNTNLDESISMDDILQYNQN